MNCCDGSGCSDCADTTIGCEAFCGARISAEESLDKRYCDEATGLPYCSMSCKLFVFGCAVLDMPVDLIVGWEDRVAAQLARLDAGLTGRAKAGAS